MSMTNNGRTAVNAVDAVNKIKMVLTDVGLLVSVKAAATIISRINREFTYYYTPKVGGKKKCAGFLVIAYNNVTCYVLPRSVIDWPICDLYSSLRPDIQSPIRMIATPFPDQILIADYLLKILRGPLGTGCVLLNMGAGYGKTMVMAIIAAALRVKTAYIVPKRPLAVQAQKDLRSYLVSAADSSMSRSVTTAESSDGSKKSSTLTAAGIDIFVINTALKTKFDHTLVIFDEVHSYCTEKRKSIFSIANAKYMVGATATSEDRRDGFDTVSHEWLRRVVHADSIPGFEYNDQAFTGTTYVVGYHGPPEYTKNLKHETTDLLFTHYMHQQTIADAARVTLLTDIIVALYDETHILPYLGDTDPAVTIHRGRRIGVGTAMEQVECRNVIYVFAEELSILEDLMRSFRAQLSDRDRSDVADSTIAPELTAAAVMTSPDTNDEAAMFVGGLKNAEITNVVTKAIVIFSTYGYSGTGVSVPAAVCEVFATPRRSGMKQIIARILRRGSDTRIPRRVFDIVDKKTAMSRQFPERRLGYEHYNFTLRQHKVCHESLASDSAALIRCALRKDNQS